ncbi:phosphatase PAP2 family protein [Gudongella oleilytica]|jgi:undecaprenyl-diphosphatase|uniref:phosphatase PAP2 family protein n=1 Tax=Gudongella oleilytica TaxID=1582259 RepID=UPI000EE1CE49|nr:phosphatase PAP2 family protein [Gudongella oleilytica]MDY0256320.1 phosphatase PAP2 family protein [Gudongella oleilytica]HCO18727.1 phosphatase PAP2 family protein [Tissierellales bacterium]HMM69253.1 phosphatase PAP2 family protein [Gudongella oleilytica]
MKILKKFDSHFIHLINTRIKNKYLDRIMIRVTDLGGAVFTTIFATALIVFGSKQVKFMGLEAIVALSFGQIFVQSLKKLFSRERPYKILEHLHTFGIDLRDYSFPSGHTTASFSLATTIALNMPKFTILVFFMAIIIGMSRIYLGVHYPTDVAAGIILGITASVTVHMHFLPFVGRIGSIIGIN